jgi:PH domain
LSFCGDFLNSCTFFFRESEQQAAYRASVQSLGSRLGGRLSVGPTAEPAAADIAAFDESPSAATNIGGGGGINGRLLLREENVKQLELTSLGQVKRSKARRLLLLNDSVRRIFRTMEACTVQKI